MSGQAARRGQTDTFGGVKKRKKKKKKEEIFTPAIGPLCTFRFTWHKCECGRKQQQQGRGGNVQPAFKKMKGEEAEIESWDLDADT